MEYTKDGTGYQFPVVNLLCCATSSVDSITIGSVCFCGVTLQCLCRHGVAVTTFGTI